MIDTNSRTSYQRQRITIISRVNVRHIFYVPGSCTIASPVLADPVMDKYITTIQRDKHNKQIKQCVSKTSWKCLITSWCSPALTLTKWLLSFFLWLNQRGKHKDPLKNMSLSLHLSPPTGRHLLVIQFITNITPKLCIVVTTLDTRGGNSIHSQAQDTSDIESHVFLTAVHHRLLVITSDFPPTPQLPVSSLFP